MRRHIISVLVENRFGVLSRIAGLFSARGFNIDSLCVGETLDPDVSRMTIVTHGEDRVIEQIEKQLNKLIDVIEVRDFTVEDHVDRELVLIKVSTDGTSRPTILEYVNIFRAKTVDVSPESLTLEVTGSEGKVAAFIDLLRPFGIQQIARTGRIAMARG